MFICFLWDDPLFAPELSTIAGSTVRTDPEWVITMRRLRLTALEDLYKDIEHYKEEAALWRAAAAREAWTGRQLIDHVPASITERVLVERRVNMADPDFYFAKAIGLE